jgi:hypothetical protein
MTLLGVAEPAIDNVTCRRVSRVLSAWMKLSKQMLSDPATHGKARRSSLRWVSKSMTTVLTDRVLMERNGRAKL